MSDIVGIIENRLMIQLSSEYIDDYCEEIKQEYDELTVLEEKIEKMIEKKKVSFTGLSDVGNGIFVKTKVKDQDKIFIYIGCGVYVEFPFEEALIYVREKKNKIAVYILYFSIIIVQTIPYDQINT